MTHGSLFSGIGGFDLAAEWMGWENMFHCEWNEFGQKVLKYYWPAAELFTDITKSDFTKYANRIDILTGGFPCQPYSLAGKRKGKEDERHLWPEMLRAIREIQPRWVVGENVFGLINWSGGLVFHEVQADLEAAGYEVWPYVLPACSVNAPHRRDRVWFVAHSVNDRYKAGRGQESQENSLSGIGRTAMDTGEFNGTSFSSTTPNPTQTDSGDRLQTRTGGNGVTGMGNDGDAADTSHQGLQRNERYSENEGQNKIWGKGAPGAVSELYRRSNFEQFPTQSPICIGNDGVSSKLDGITFSKWRNESIKAAGNAIVPQVVYQIFKAIEEYENTTHNVQA